MNRGVPVWQLVVLILVILASGIVAYIFYDERVRLNDDLAGMRNSLQQTEQGIANAKRDLGEMYKTMGLYSRQEVKGIMGDNATTTGGAPQKLETYVNDLLKKRQELIDALGMKVSEADVKAMQLKDKDGKPLTTIDTFITPYVKQGEVPAAMQGKLIGKLIEEHIRHDKANKQREAVIRDNEAAVTQLNDEIAKKKDEAKQQIAAATQAEQDAWAKRTEARDKLRLEPLKWAKEKEAIVAEVNLEEAINQKLQKQVALQADQASPIDGRVVAFDWKTGRGTINLGAQDRVRPGYEFDVFSMRPGPNRADKRIHSGHIKLIDVKPDTSLFILLNRQPGTQVLPGDYVSSQIYDETEPKTFVIKGWFPKTGPYTKEAVAGLIRRDGGVVKDDLTLNTDFLVLGDMGSVKLREPGAENPAVPPADQLAGLSPEAKAKVIEGYQAYLQARHFYVPVLTMDKFRRYMDRTGEQASR